MAKWQIFLLVFFIGSSRLIAQDTTTSTCIAPSAENLQLDTSNGYADAIQNYLSAGGDPAQLKFLLQPFGVIPDSTTTEGVYILDLTGDGKDDVIVNIGFLNQTATDKTFAVWIYVCDEKHYRLVYENKSHQPPDDINPGMFIDQIQDLNHDLRPEITHHFVSCGANTCYMFLYIEGWDNTKQEMHQMLTDSFLSGDYEFTDSDGDGIFDIVVTSGVSGSAGAGPQRHWQTSYGWDGINFTRRRSVPEAPRLAFEAAQDAAVALNAGDLQTAAILYQRILDDPTLKGIDEQTDAITKSQALFGLLIIRTFQHDYASADNLYTQLQNFQGIPIDTFATGYSESLWTEVGRIFYKEADHKYDLSTACEAVLAELNEARSIKPGSRDYPTSYWGHFGTPPKPEVMCPF